MDVISDDFSYGLWDVFGRSYTTLNKMEKKDTTPPIEKMNLSKKADYNFGIGKRIYFEKDVKEFIRALRIELYLDFKNGFDSTDSINWLSKFDVEKTLNKLAGDKLNGTKD